MPFGAVRRGICVRDVVGEGYEREQGVRGSSDVTRASRGVEDVCERIWDERGAAQA